MTNSRPVTSQQTSITEFFARFPDEDACIHHLFETRFGDHSPCPYCKSMGRWFRLKGRMAYRHSNCRKNVSVLKGTIFYQTYLPLRMWFYAILLFANSTHGVRARFLAKHLGITSLSAYRMGKLIRIHLALRRRHSQLGGPGKHVYIDEAIFKCYSPREECHSSRQIVFGMSCQGQVLCGTVPDRTIPSLIGNIERYVRPGSILVTDGLRTYLPLSQRGWKHISTYPGKKTTSARRISNSSIEIYWAKVRRNLRAHRRISQENLWLYLAEIEYRYNRRNARESVFDDIIGEFPELSLDDLDRVKKSFCWQKHRVD